jgi:hypothetical protein
MYVQLSDENKCMLGFVCYVGIITILLIYVIQYNNWKPASQLVSILFSILFNSAAMLLLM